MTTTATLLINGPDRRGLVARIATFISENNGNITHSDHHIDTETGLFLTRVEWELEGFQIPRGEIAARFAALAKPLDMRWDLHFSDVRARMAIFVSKYDHCLHDLLLRTASGELRSEAALVISNHPQLR